jgi:hypothetical protein
MRFTHLAAALSLSAVASAQLTYNVTQAYAKGNWEKYRCLYVAPSYHPIAFPISLP